MQAIFLAMSSFQRHRDEYFDDESFRALQKELMRDPEAGDLIQGTGGLRKIRFADKRRGKGKRSGLRVIYYWTEAERQFWLFTVFDKDIADDLTMEQRALFRNRLQAEIRARSDKR